MDWQLSRECVDVTNDTIRMDGKLGEDEVSEGDNLFSE